MMGATDTLEAQGLISKQIPRSRRKEIYEYLKLFG